MIAAEIFKILGGFIEASVAIVLCGLLILVDFLNPESIGGIKNET